MRSFAADVVAAIVAGIVVVVAVVVGAATHRSCSQKRRAPSIMEWRKRYYRKSE